MALSRHAMATDGNVAEQIKTYFDRYYVRNETNLPQPLKEKRYKYKKGVCFIFDHYKYKDNEHSIRYGTQYDRAGLNKVFVDMKFDVREYVDKTKDKIFEVLHKFADDKKDSCDCLVICVMSHGDKTSLAANDRMYPLETMCEIFYGNSCPKLKGCPKIFIINACRGMKIDDGIDVEEEDLIADDIVSHSLPTTADFLFAFSSFSDYYSYRDEFVGTWFIQSLITVLNENMVSETKLDFESLLTIVMDRVALNNEFEDTSGKRHKQMPVKESTLRKKVYIPNV